MFKDTKEELRRLQAQLLAEEETQRLELELEEDDSILFEDFEEFDDFDQELAQIQAILGKPKKQPQQVGYQNYSNNYGRGRPQAARVYNTDDTDTELDEYSEEVYEAKPKSLKGLVITACCLLAGIGGVLLWWVVRFL